MAESWFDYAKSTKAACPTLNAVFMTGWLHRAPERAVRPDTTYF